MVVRSRWLAASFAAVCGALIVLRLAAPHWGIHDFVFLLLVLVGLAGPVIAAIHLGGAAASSRPFRRNLLALLVIPAVASVLAGWLGRGGVAHTLAVVVVFMGVAAASVGALLAQAVARGGREEFEGFARSLWTLVLIGGVFFGSLPLGWGFMSLDLRRARAWVERAAAEVRVVEGRTGRIPSDLREVLGTVGPAPPDVTPPWGGYFPSEEEGTFEFRINDGGAPFFGWWLFDGRSGEWSYVSD